jgi:HSF-type DNA-binding
MPSIENSLNSSVLANPPRVSVSNGGHKTDRKVDKSADGYGSQFPYKLHRLLDDAKCLGFEDVVAWTSDGRAFQIFDKKKLETLILPHYFSSGRFKTVRTTSLQSDCSVFSLLIVLSTVPTVAKSMEFSSRTFAG